MDHFLTEITSRNHLPTSSEPLGDSVSSSVYYGVSVLPGSSCSEADSFVFTDKTDALTTARKYKGARFKAFSSKEEAFSFSVQHSSTPTHNNTSWEASSPMADVFTSPEVLQNNIEKPCPFKAPRSQEMVQLRKAIEIGDLDFFTVTVWSNPRYLISSGETPSIMQEGFRYNGLHVAAKNNQPRMCQAILTTIEDEKFLKLLFSDDQPHVIQQRKKFIVDLYLNMPDKGMCETPLHFASKFGCSGVVEILLNHYACVRTRQNKYGQTPKEVICERCGDNELKRKIEEFYEARYYVAVLRSEGNSVQPIIGRPFSFEDNILSVTKQQVTPKNPLLSVKAKAGPMPRPQAEVFYKMWKAPTTPLNMTAQEVRFSDSDKGLERIGRSIADYMNVPWVEYWSFLNGWCNLSSADGLNRLEVHLKQMYHNAVNEMKALDESYIGCSIVDDSMNSPMTQLCRQFEAIHLDSSFDNSSNVSSLISDNYAMTPPSNYITRANKNDHLSQVVKSLQFDSPPSTTIESNRVAGRRSIDVTPAYLRSPESSFLTLKPRRLDFHINEISETLSLKLSDFFSVGQSFGFIDLMQNVLHIYEKFFQVVSMKSNTNLHRDIAKHTAQKLVDNISMNEISKMTNFCKSLSDEEDMDQSFSDSDDSKLESCGRRSMSVPDPARTFKVNHLKCILRHLNQFLNPECETSKLCICSWDMTRLSNDLGQSCIDEAVCKSTSDEDVSEDEFLTPPCSQNNSRSNSPGMHTPDEGIEVYVEGLKPTKSDLDVLNALQGTFIDTLLYPHVHLWKHLVETFPKEVTKGWSSPAMSVLRARSAPPRFSKRDTLLQLNSSKHKASSVFTNKIMSRFSKKSPSEIKNLYDCFNT